MLPWYGRGGYQFGDLGLVGISNHPFDARHGRQFIGRALRVAAGHQDARRGILAMHAAQRLAHIVVRGGCDCAGIQNHQVRMAALGRRFQSLGGKQRFESGAIGLGSPASEILHEKLIHWLHYSGGLKVELSDASVRILL